MRILSFICAESVFVDANSKQVCIFNLLEELSVQAFPASIPRFCVLVILKRDTADPDNVVLQLSAKVDREKIFAIPFSVSFDGKTRARSIVQLRGAYLSKAGSLEIAVLTEGNSLGSWSIEINAAGTTAAQPPLLHIR